MNFTRDFRALLMLFTLMAVLPGCATAPNSDMAQLAVQYATAKTIEQSDSITAAGVIRYTETARALVDQDVTLDPARIAAQILQAIDAEQLSPADRVLAQVLVLQVQAQFEELDLLDPSTRVTVLQVLEWIEQAARMSQDSGSTI